MKLKRQYDRVEDLPPAYKDLYVEEDGKWVRDDNEIEGVVAGEKFAEFRENNRKLSTQLEDLKKEMARFKDVDPEEYLRLKAKPPEGGADKVSQLETRITELTTKLETSQKQYENQVAAAKAEADKAKADLEQHEIDADITKAAIAGGIDEHGLEDVLLRGHRLFKRVEGKTVAMNGEAPRYSEKTPAKLLDPDLWISEELSAKAPHLFKPSNGGGANNGGRGNGQRSISASDPLAFGKNLEDIASGKVTVQG